MITPTRTVSAGSTARLCHVCGQSFPKTALPNHQRSCIRKSVSSLGRSSRSSSQSSIRGLESLDPKSPGFDEFVPRPPSLSAPSYGRPKNFRSPRQDESPRSAAAAAEETSPRVIPKKRQPKVTNRLDTIENGMEKPVLDIVKQQETPKKTASVKLSPPKQEYPPSEFNPVETIEEPVYTKPKFPKATQEVAGYTMPDTEKINVDISDDLVVCDICNRKFLADRLDRHQEACSKSQKQRKVFDVKKARVQGTDMEKYQGKQQEQKPPKKNNWRAKHMAFIQLVRSARDGTTLPSSQLVDPNPDYVTCPHCARRFNEAAAERHMPHCKEKATAQARNQSQSKEALKKRISYKPPTPRKLKK